MAVTARNEYRSQCKTPLEQHKSFGRWPTNTQSARASVSTKAALTVVRGRPCKHQMRVPDPVPDTLRDILWGIVRRKPATVCEVASVDKRAENGQRVSRCRQKQKQQALPVQLLVRHRRYKYKEARVINDT
ncbi:hypothetical protein BaRGS_00000114 [Batillaria attramentaria]|uniref:Uncharacterized protein n=1 Tax=Batillaria attramentaria TaxID=370345 RepID=A0ABD0MC79_9CAEN